MRIALVDATCPAGQRSTPDHGLHALARMAQREGHWVGTVERAGRVAGRQPERPGSDVMHVFATAARLPTLGDVLDGRCPTVLTLVDLPAPGGGMATIESMPGIARVAFAVARSAYAARQWQRCMPGAAFRVLPQGVDLLALMQAQVRRNDRAAVAPSPLTLASVGPFDPRSGVETLLRAFAAVPGGNLRLQLLGAFDPATAHGRCCQDLAAADARVRIVPDVVPGSLVPVADQVDLACVPSLDPLAFALPVHEAAALGVACLVSDLGAQAEAAGHFGGAECLPPGDVPAWARAIRHWADRFDRRRPPPPDAPLPMRLEEEAFLYDGLYLQAVYQHRRG
jgi:glycosyltransferase involved in cell wall biosynthesis